MPFNLRRRDGCVVVSEKAKGSWESVHPFQLEVSVARSDIFIFFQLYVIVFDVFALQLSWFTSWSQRVFHFAGPLLLWFCFFLRIPWNAKFLPLEL